jgi:ubiquinone/menaquinone biosynthesis C-methylase UbiE
MNPEDTVDLVERGYDRVAESYLATKGADATTIAALEDLGRRLPSGAAVLDLGCGAGVPATRWLSERFAVTGVDVSARQLELARRHVPTATFVKADMVAVDFAPGSFDAVVALHSIIHVPRVEHAGLLRKTSAWLKPGGLMLAALSLRAYEGEDEDWEGWGAPMRWSHYDRKTNERMLGEAGFEILRSEALSGGGTGDAEETWLWVLARKRADT